MKIQSATTVDVSPQQAKLQKAAKSFESFFVYQMIQSMRKTVTKTDFLNGGFAEDTFTGLLDQQYADSTAGNFGIAKAIVNDYLKYMRGNDGGARPARLGEPAADAQLHEAGGHDGESLGGNESLPHSPAQLYVMPKRFEVKA